MKDSQDEVFQFLEGLVHQCYHEYIISSSVSAGLSIYFAT